MKKYQPTTQREGYFQVGFVSLIYHTSLKRGRCLLWAEKLSVARKRMRRTGNKIERRFIKTQSCQI